MKTAAVLHYSTHIYEEILKGASGILQKRAATTTSTLILGVILVDRHFI
jgi:hypothetical protein